MPLETKKKMLSESPKSLKTKDNRVSSDNSKKSGSVARKRVRYGDMYDDIEAKFSVLERADRVLSSMASDAPSFIKCMLPSNVSHGFWLHLPKKFCSLHLPGHDVTIVLEDEWGNEYKTSYLLERNGLSAGWRAFSISHRLLKGDILIFLLVEPLKLKVHIVRVNSSDVVGAALCLMNLDACQRDPVKKGNRKRKQTTYIDPFLLDISAPFENAQSDERNTPNFVLEPLADQSDSNGNGFGSEVCKGIESTSSPRVKELCYSKTPFLHGQPREVVTFT